MKELELMALVLTCSLLLLLAFVQGEWGEWEVISDEEAQKILEGRHLIEPVQPYSNARPEIQTRPPDLKFHDKLEDEVYEYYDFDEKPSYDKGDPDVDWKVEPKIFDYEVTDASSLDPYGQGEVEVEEVEVEVEEEDPTGFHFVCTEDAFKIYLSQKELDTVKLIRLKDVRSIEGSPECCGYVDRDNGTLVVPYTGCFTTNENNVYSVQLSLAEGTEIRNVTCLGPQSVQSKASPQNKASPRAFPMSSLNCSFTSGDPSWELLFGPQADPNVFALMPVEDGPLGDPLENPPITPPVAPLLSPLALSSPLGQICSSSHEERLGCAFNVTEGDCLAHECCWDPASSFCFYPENECTPDGHFVFIIRRNSAPVDVEPRNLVIPNNNCPPAIVTEEFAVFKFRNDECGTRTFSVGATTVYLAEVQMTVKSLNLQYGRISRSPQVRFLIECRYSSENVSLATTGYMVTTPSVDVPASVSFKGLYGVVLNIATDENYTSFYPTYSPPLSRLLGKKVHLQLQLLSPVPKATILVNFCVAYPRVATNALVLVHEGCPNLYDPEIFIRPNKDFNGEKNERRFEVNAFQFIDVLSNQYIDEEIYFMCSAVLCFESEKPCVERCFDGSVPKTT